MKALTQFYSVDAPVVAGKRIRFDEPTRPESGLPDDPNQARPQCQFIVTSADRALDVASRTRGGDPTGNLSHIEYTIIGCPGTARRSARLDGLRTQVHLTPVSAAGIRDRGAAEKGALSRPYQERTSWLDSQEIRNRARHPIRSHENLSRTNRCRKIRLSSQNARTPPRTRTGSQQLLKELDLTGGVAGIFPTEAREGGLRP